MIFAFEEDNGTVLRGFDRREAIEWLKSRKVLASAEDHDLIGCGNAGRQRRITDVGAAALVTVQTAAWIS